MLVIPCAVEVDQQYMKELYQIRFEVGPRAVGRLNEQSNLSVVHQECVLQHAIAYNCDCSWLAETTALQPLFCQKLARRVERPTQYCSKPVCLSPGNMTCGLICPAAFIYLVLVSCWLWIILLVQQEPWTEGRKNLPVHYNLWLRSTSVRICSI